MNAAELYVEEHAGAPDAPVVVLVHGVFDSCASFEGVIEHLLPDHTVLTYDRRGWARSADATPAAALDDHADDLLSVLGERRATVVGHSYGGTVSFLAAVRAPERIAALGLFEPSMQWQPYWPSMDAIAAEAPYEQEHFRAGLEGKPRRTREERDREQALLQHELTLIAEAPCTPEQLTVPRLVGRGSLSATWRFGTTDHLRDDLDCELIEIDGAGHTAHRMQPKGFADFVRGAGRVGDGASVNVVEHPGVDGAPVVLLIHGLTDSVESFGGVVDELTPEHTVVTYDRRGWGRSRDDEPPTSLADHAQDAIDALAGRRATVVGHSYGGVVALMAAVKRPDLVASLAVFEPTVPFTDWWPDHDEMMRRSLDLKPMFKRWNEGVARRTPEQRAADELSMARDFSFVATAPFDFTAVTVPCLVGGSVDTTPWDFQSAERLSELLDADMVVFRDAGHTVHRTHAREFADFTRRAVALGR